MEEIANPKETINGSQTLPMIVIIGDQVLARTCIVKILKRELTGFEIAEVTTTSDLGWLSERNVRPIAFDIGDKQIADPSVEDRLTLFEEAFQMRLLRCCQIAPPRPRPRRRCNGWYAGFFQPRLPSRSRSPDCASFSQVGCTDHYRSSGKMKRRAAKFSRNVPALRSLPSSTSVTATRLKLVKSSTMQAPRLSLQAPTRLSVGKT